MAVAPDQMFLLLSDNKSTIFNSTKAIFWSHNNKIVLCCAEKLVIASIISCPYLNSKTEVFMTIVHETPDLSILPKFSFASGLLQFKASVDNLSEGDRQRLSFDPALTEDSVYPNSIINTFKHVVCSPVFLDSDRPENLIAAVTYDHRVVITGERPEGWNFVLDCSPAIKEHTISKIPLPITIGTTMSLNSYIDLVHRMCAVELEWSSLFTSNVNEEQQFLLLFIGMKSGVTTVWKTCLPFETKDDFIFQCTDTYTSEVTALSWLGREENKGLLALGHLDGSVRVLSVLVSCDVPSTCVKVEEIFADFQGDCLAISDLAWAHIDKASTVLIGCKQYFLSLYSLCGSTIKLVRHYHLDVGLPLTSISTFGAGGVASSQDGVLTKFHCKLDSDEVILDCSTIAITSMPFSSELPWMCMGVAISPSSGLCLSGHRISHSCRTVEVKRKFMNREMIALSIPFKCTEETVKEALSSESVYFSVQDVIINIRLHIQHTVETNGSLQDFLELYSVLNERNDVRSIQVARDILLLLKHAAVCRTDYGKQLDWVSSAHEKISEKLMVKHIESCLQKVTQTPATNELSVIKAMLNWLQARHATLPDISHTFDLTQLINISQQVPEQHCAICGSTFSIIGFLLAKCLKGHHIKLCALTLLPCQDFSGRKCESCHHPSVGLSALSDVKMIKLKWLCILCGGYLRQAIV